tara:strand:- start:3030 stop:3260 length:231 start_codon:yes stop_codon:yes gene_type:complete
METYRENIYLGRGEDAIVVETMIQTYRTQGHWYAKAEFELDNGTRSSLEIKLNGKGHGRDKAKQAVRKALKEEYDL